RDGRNRRSLLGTFLLLAQRAQLATAERALGRRGDGGNRRGHRRGRGGLLRWSRRGPVLRAVVEVGGLPLPGLARRTTPLRAEIAVAVAGIGLRGGRRRRGRSRRRVVLRKRLTLLGDVAERLGRGIRDRRRRRG